jgi:hypothetical protein
MVVEIRINTNPEQNVNYLIDIRIVVDTHFWKTYKGTIPGPIHLRRMLCCFVDISHKP